MDYSSPGNPQDGISGHETTVECLSALLESLYWDGVEREICNMILALSEMNKIYEEPVGSEVYDSASFSLQSKNYHTVFKTWCMNSRP